MENKELKEQNIILNYLKENRKDISIEDREFLIRYAASKIKMSFQETYTVDTNNFLKDLKKLSQSFSDCNNTSLTAERMTNVINLFEEFQLQLDEDKMLELSIKLDKLFLESGLSVRNTDTVLKKILKKEKEKNNGSR